MLNNPVFLQMQSFFALALMFTGVYFRNKRSLHIKIMLTTIILDLLIIAELVFFRNATGKAMRFVSNPLALNIHVFLAITYTLLLVVILVTGYRLYRGQESIRKYHKAIGITTVIARILVFVSSFWAVSR